MTKETSTTEVNIFGVDKIIKIGKMFEREGMELSSIFIKESDIKVVKKEFDIHGSDIDENRNTIAFVMIPSDDKFHRAWFKLIGYNQENFTHWKLTREDIEYKIKD